jgi:hypothetical protein
MKRLNKHNKLVYLTAIGVCVLSFSLTSCKSSKSVTTGQQAKAEIKEAEKVTNTKEQIVVNKFCSTHQSINVLTSKIKVDAKVGDKMISLNGSLKMKRNEVIQISLQIPIPLMNIEAGRIEITPDYILIIDRIHKQYVKSPISQLTILAKTDLDFYALQALFSNNVFAPGTTEMTDNTLKSFELSTDVTDKATLLSLQDKQLNYVFSLQDDGTLTQSRIGTKNGINALTWKYDNFKDFEGTNFPRHMTISFSGSKNPIETSIEISKPENNTDWDTHTEISSKYKQITLQDAAKMIQNL